MVEHFSQLFLSLLLRPVILGVLLEGAEGRKKNIEPFNIDFGGRVATYVDRDLTAIDRRDPKLRPNPSKTDPSRQDRHIRRPRSHQSWPPRPKVDDFFTNLGHLLFWRWRKLRLRCVCVGSALKKANLYRRRYKPASRFFYRKVIAIFL